MPMSFNPGKSKDKLTKLKLRFWKKKKNGTGTVSDQNQGENVISGSSTLTNAHPLGSSDDSPRPQTLDIAYLNQKDDYQDTLISELWNVAYDNLRKEKKALIDEYETELQKSVPYTLDSTIEIQGNREKWMSYVLKHKMEEVQKDTWKLMFLDSRIQQAGIVEPVFNVIKLVSDAITPAALPTPQVSLAWAGISALISVCLNPENQAASLTKGLRYISSLIIQGRMREDLYRRRYEARGNACVIASEAHSKYKATLEGLYRQILRFQVECYCYYAKNKASRLFNDLSKQNDWDGLIDKIHRQECQMAAIDEIWRDQQYDEECAAANDRHQGTILNLKAIGANITDLQKAVQNANKDTDNQEFLAWLCDVDPSPMYNAARNKHKDGTSEWLIKDNSKFKSWAQSPHSLLWLHGKAGSGKSILSSSAIQYLRKEHEQDATTVLAYFYFSFSDIKKQERDGMLASLIKQICCHRPNIPESVKVLGEYKKQGMRPCTKELEKCLMTTIRGFSAVYIIIDALDECPELDGQRDGLMKTLIYILQEKPNNLHILLTSRQEPDIDASLRCYLSEPERVEIDLSTHLSEIKHDINQYINLTLADANYKSWPDDIKAEVTKVLIEKSDGMFQYIRCQFEALQKLRSFGDIRRVLDDLPKGLDDTYKRMLQGIDNQYRKQVANSLRWLAFSVEPLSVDELAEIFVMHPDNDDVIGDRLFNTQDVLTYFSGLIVVEKQKQRLSDLNLFPMEESSDPVRLAHFSIKEYLTSDRMRQDLIEDFSFSDVDSHLFIAHSCLAYHLHLSAIYHQSIGKNHPLKKYAALNWPVHLEMVPHEYGYAGIIEKIERALALRSQSLINMIVEHLGRKKSATVYEELDASSITSMHLRPYCFTIQHGFTRLTNILLSQESTAIKYLTRGDLNMALWYAVNGGDKQVVLRLLDQGADANASRVIMRNTERNPKECINVLQLASSNGGEAIVNLLLDRGADIDANRGILALRGAAYHGHLEVLKLLVKRGADINGLPNEEGGILSEAILSEKCFQFLLDNGADVNMRGTGSGRRTALYHAAKHRRWDQLDLLLERGADVNLSHPLHALVATTTGCYRKASTKDDLTLSGIKRLLDLGADPNAIDEELGTALHAACRCREINTKPNLHLKVAQLLIGNGADVNMTARQGESALQSSVSHCCMSMVKLLLQNGADAKLQGGQNGSALQAACIHGIGYEIDMLQLLLYHGADINALGGEYGTALQAACYYINQNSTLSLLLDHGANVNAAGGRYGSALQAACVYWQKTDRAQLLLDHGADINLEGGTNGTALHAACLWNLSIEVVHFLLDHGANIHVESREYGSALQAACSGRGGRNVVRLLLDHGADVNADSGDHGTGLQIACAGSWRQHDSYAINLAQILLERGANIHVQGGRHGIPLHLAVRRCLEPLVHLLLDHGADINQVDNRLGTVLHCALFPQDSQYIDVYLREPEEPKDAAVLMKRSIDMIRLLLERGADANLSGGEYGFPLQAACSINYDAQLGERITYLTTDHRRLSGRDRQPQAGVINMADERVKTLLDECPEIDINARGGVFGTALQAAAYSGQAKTVRLLLSRKDHVLCSERCGKYGTALNAAVIKGYWHIVDILLEAGAKPDCHLLQEPDEEWLTRLQTEDGLDAEERYRKFWEVEKKVHRQALLEHDGRPSTCT